MSRRASCYTTRIGKFIEFWTHLQIKKLNFSPRKQKFIIPPPSARHFDTTSTS